MAILHKFNGEEVIATELPQLLNQNFDYVNDNRIKTVNNVEYDENNNIDVTHLVSQSIVSGTDLNNLTTSGEYVRLGSVTKLLNSPSDTPFFLTVLASDGLVKQVLTELIVNNPATFTRTMNGTQWSPWIESGANIGTWESNEQVKVGDVRYVGGRDYTGYVLECVQAGTTGDSQPTISSSDIDNSTDLEGFSGTLQIAHGGTGATSQAGARTNLGLGSVATENIVPVNKGGTGATTTEGARNNLGLRIQTFTSTSELGLTNNATELEILNAMPAQSVFLRAVTKASFPNLVLWNYTSSNTRLRLTRNNNDSFVLEAFAIGSETTVFMATANTDATSVKYTKIADASKYFPLTGGELTGAVRVNKGSDWGQFVAYSSSGYYRAFEANDGAIRLDVRNDKDTLNRRFLDIRNSLGIGDLGNAILLHDTIDGVDKFYKILGEHNTADYIVETYRNGTEWYEVYKSGKVRQGGLASNTGSAERVVTFLKPFANADYSLDGVMNYNATWDKACMLYMRPKNTSSFSAWITVYNSSFETEQAKYYWVAEGQGA